MADGEQLTGAEVRRRLNELAPQGLAETTWAVEAGVNRGFFTNLATVKSPRMDSIRKLLNYIGKTEADLYGFAPESNAREIKYEGASDIVPRQDLPVFGTALGAEAMIDGAAIEQTYLNSGEVVEYRNRPPVLNGVLNAYGIYVQGSSMYPALRDGSLWFVQKGAPLRTGDDVVVYLRPQADADDGETAEAVLVKRLVRRTAQYIELEQFQPGKVFRIPSDRVLRVDRVLTTEDYA